MNDDIRDIRRRLDRVERTTDSIPIAVGDGDNSPGTHDTLTGTLTTATVANQVWATVTPAPGYESFGPTVRVQLADNASARPAGDKVIAHRFKDVQSLANPPEAAVDVAWEETPSGGVTYAVELAADLDRSDTTASVWRMIPGTNARQDDGADPPSLSPAFNVGNSLGLAGYGADNTTDLNPAASESEARGTFGVIQEVADPATGSASFELVELLGVVPFEQVTAGEEYSTTATFEGAYPSGDNRDNPPPSQLGGDYTTENMAAITEKNLDGLTVWWKDTPERVRLFERPLVPCEFVNNLFTGSKGSTTTLRPLDSAGVVLSDGGTDALDFAAQVLTDDQYGLAGWKCWACKSRQTNKWSLVWHERYVQRVTGPMNLGGGTLNVASVQGVGEHTPSNPVSYSDPTGLASDLKNGDTLIIGFTGFTSGSGPSYTVLHCDDGKVKTSKDDSREFLEDKFSPVFTGNASSAREPDPDNDVLLTVEFLPTPEGDSPTDVQGFVYAPAAGGGANDGRVKVSSSDTLEYLGNKFTPVFAGNASSARDPDPDNDTLLQVEFLPTPAGANPTDVEAYVYTPPPEPGAYDIRLPASKISSQASSSANILDASGSPSGQSITVYDPAREFSTGFRANALGLAVRATDPVTGLTQFTLANLEGPALFVSGILDEDSDGGIAIAITGDCTFWGPAWHNATPGSSFIRVHGLTDNEDVEGGAFTARLLNPDTFPLQYQADKGGGFSEEKFQFVIKPGDQVSAASWSAGRKVNGTGTVTLLVDDPNNPGEYTEGGSQSVEWGYGYALGASTNEAYFGSGTIIQNRYVIDVVDTCNDVDTTS